MLSSTKIVVSFIGIGRKGTLLVAISVLMFVMVACSNQTGVSNTNHRPIKIGTSLSLAGTFADDGLAFQQGYQLWADHINAHGGLLGRKVVLDMLADNSTPEQVTANYQKLITLDHVDILFGPFSTVLTQPASVVADRYGYALVEGAGGGPSIFSRGLHTVFDVSLPVANNLASFARWIATLPLAQRPKTAVYATQNDPFTQPQVDVAYQLLTKEGITAAAPTITYTADATNFTAIAQKISDSHADIVVLGTLFTDCSALVQAFKQQHYTPKIIIATAGPDQGAQFLQAIVGGASAEGIMVPNSWFAQEATPGNAAMIQAYLATYGGSLDSISTDIPEAYSVGQVIEQAVDKIGTLDQDQLLQELHNDTFTTVQGPVTFDSTGQNTAIQAYLFQWQHGALKPVYPTDAKDTVPFEYPKPSWP